jgi:uncharacterized membrane protein YtjA (UPF0391 family)
MSPTGIVEPENREEEEYGMNARTFALVFGVVYLIVGLLGFTVTGMSMEADADAPRLLGLFPVNVLHNIVHLAIGAWGLASYRSLNGSIAYARGLAILYGLLAIMGLLPAPFNTTFGLVPIFGHDVWLHAGTALIAAYFGFVAPGERETPQVVDASRHRR